MSIMIGHRSLIHVSGKLNVVCMSCVFSAPRTEYVKDGDVMCCL